MSQTLSHSDGNVGPISPRQIFAFFLPMALSWTIMALEAPIVTIFMAKLPDPNISIAAFGLVATLSFVIETPVLGLLSTATALTVDLQHYRMVRNFAFMMMALVTVAAAVVVLTPMFDIAVRSILGVPEPVAAAAKQGMFLMIPWSAGVGFRRYAQGILIRNGITKPLMIGTALRLITMALIGSLMFRRGNCTGVQLGCTAWVVGVWVEALYIQAISLPTVRAIVKRGDAPASEAPLTLRALAAYHFPLTLANLLWLIARPLYVWGLSNAALPTLKLASLEASNQLMFLFRAPAFAMPESVIALSSRDKAGDLLRKFSVQFGSAMWAFQFLACASGLAAFLYIRVIRVPDETAYSAIIILLIVSPVALLATFQGFLKGRLSYLRKTSGLTLSILIHVLCLCVMIPVLVATRTIGIETTAIVLVVATLIETVFLQKYLKAATRAAG